MRYCPHHLWPRSLMPFKNNWHPYCSPPRRSPPLELTVDALDLSLYTGVLETMELPVDVYFPSMGLLTLSPAINQCIPGVSFPLLSPSREGTPRH